MTIVVDCVDAGHKDLWFSELSMKKRPVAMSPNSSFSYWEEFRSDGFALITELLLLSVLQS